MMSKVGFLIVNIAIVILLLFKSSVGLLPSLCGGAGLPDGSPSIPKELHCPRMFLYRRYIPRPLPKGGALRYSSIPKASESRILFSQCKNNSRFHYIFFLHFPCLIFFLSLLLKLFVSVSQHAHRLKCPHIIYVNIVHTAFK